MKIKLHRDFEKQYQKLREGEKKKFKARRDLFLLNEFHPILNNHTLSGKYLGCRSINVTGDLRAIYTKSDNEVTFITIGSHSYLYS